MIRKVILFSLGNKGLATLESLLREGYADLIEAVVIGKDKNVVNDYAEEQIEMCKANGILYTFKNQKHDFKANFWFAIGWRWLIKEPKDVSLIIFHESLLPKYRGFAPLVNQLINGEKKIGVTALLASENFDEGPVIAQESVEVNYPIKIENAIELVSILYSKIAIGVIKTIKAVHNLELTPQDESLATYSVWRDEEDYFLNWNHSAERIARSVDALGFPYIGAKAYIANQEVTIDAVTLIPDVQIENRDVGKVMFIKDQKPIVICKTGLIRIDKATYIGSGKSALPLTKFRSRFK